MAGARRELVDQEVCSVTQAGVVAKGVVYFTEMLIGKVRTNAMDCHCPIILSSPGNDDVMAFDIYKVSLIIHDEDDWASDIGPVRIDIRNLVANDGVAERENITINNLDSGDDSRVVFKNIAAQAIKIDSCAG